MNPRCLLSELSVVPATVVSCPDTGCTLRPSRKPSCGTTARTPGTCGTLPGTCTSSAPWRPTGRHSGGSTGTGTSTSTRSGGRERARLRKAERRKARAPKGSPGQLAERAHIARLRAREADRRKDWCEKVSTSLARRFDLIRFEDLRIKNMTRSAKGTAGNPGSRVQAKSGLNRAILAQGWGLLVRRTRDKAPGRVETVRAAYTSLRCSTCGWIDKNSRDSQAGFCCVACGFTCNADINASINIAAGHAGGTPASVREPQLLASLTGPDAVEISPISGRGCQAPILPCPTDISGQLCSRRRQHRFVWMTLQAARTWVLESAGLSDCYWPW
jgi:Putative transposase DNA-binding domain/Probable transposase